MSRRAVRLSTRRRPKTTTCRAANTWRRASSHPGWRGRSKAPASLGRQQLEIGAAKWYARSAHEEHTRGGNASRTADRGSSFRGSSCPAPGRCAYTLAGYMTPCPRTWRIFRLQVYQDRTAYIVRLGNAGAKATHLMKNSSEYMTGGALSPSVFRNRPERKRLL